MGTFNFKNCKFFLELPPSPDTFSNQPQIISKEGLSQGKTNHSDFELRQYAEINSIEVTGQIPTLNLILMPFSKHKTLISDLV